MALTHITPMVLDVPSVTVALINDTTVNGIRDYVDSRVAAGATAPPGTSTTQLATTEFVTRADNLKANIANPTFTGVPAAPTAAVGTNTTQLATTEFVTRANNLKANIASPTFTGIPAAPTAPNGTDTGQLATTAFVQNATALVTSTIPTFSGGVGGAEGGEIHLKKPPTSTLAGDVVIDAVGNIIRFFEGGGNYRGVYLDLSAMQTGVGTNLFSGFPAGTRLPFAQAAAPTGWTQDTSDQANNRMLRVVSGGGGGVGGVHDPSINNVVPSHTHAFTTGGVSANHTHTYSYPSAQAWAYWPGGTCYSGGAISSTSGGQSVNHTHSGSTDNGSSRTNWTPRYINMIICAKN